MSKKRILKLTIKRKWFDMIAIGEKKEEYRNFVGYYKRRLQYYTGNPLDVLPGWIKYDEVQLFNGGYLSESLPFIRCKWNGAKIGKVNPEWAPKDTDPDQIFFCIDVSEILEVKL